MLFMSLPKQKNKVNKLTEYSLKNPHTIIDLRNTYYSLQPMCYTNSNIIIPNLNNTHFLAPLILSEVNQRISKTCHVILGCNGRLLLLSKLNPSHLL